MVFLFINFLVFSRAVYPKKLVKEVKMMEELKIQNLSENLRKTTCPT
jgi:hypothetical protein